MNRTIERRKSHRIQLRREATLSFISTTYKKFWTENSSLLGMFIKGNFQQKVGDDCVIKFTQRGKLTSLPLVMSAKIVRKDDHGIAIAFTSVPLESLIPLQILLSCEDEKNAPCRSIKSLDNLPYEVHDDLLR